MIPSRRTGPGSDRFAHVLSRVAVGAALVSAFAGLPSQAAAFRGDGAARTGPAEPRRFGESDIVRSLIGRGVPAVFAKQAAPHVLLGLPSAASRSKDSDLLLARKGYVISYNGLRSAMNWASWFVSKGHVAPAERNAKFRPDPTLPAHLYKPNNGDFKLPGFSRGHMVRSGERTANLRENSKTYVFPNILVQAQNNNTGPWNGFENYYLDRVETQGEVAHVVAGGIFGKPPIGARGVAVPSATWKVVALLRPGQTLAQIDATTRVIAIVIPNNNDEVKVEDLWEKYRVSPASIERQTGLKLFSHLPENVAAALRAKVDRMVIPPPPPPKFEALNYDPNRVQQQQQEQQQQYRYSLQPSTPRPVLKASESRVRGHIASYFPARGFGFLRRADGKPDVFVHASALAATPRWGDSFEFDVGLMPDGRERAMALRPTEDPRP